MKFGTTLLLGAVALAGLYIIGGLDILGDKEGVTTNDNASINGNASIDDNASIIEQISTGLGSSIRIEGKETEFFTLKERMAHYNIPAVSIAFMENHKIKWTHTEGVIDKISNKPIDENTVFQAASISKPIFATVLMKYRESNPLDLDAPVNSLLSSWQLPAHEWTSTKPVTLRRLLSHSAGTTVHGFRGYASDEDVPDILGVLSGTEPANSDPVTVDLEPSTTFRYSGGGTTLAQLALQDQAGASLTELADTLLFKPLGMDHSGYFQPLSGPLSMNAAVPYREDGTPVNGGAHTYATLAAAGLWTTPSDLMRMGAGIQLSLKGGENTLLSQSSAKEMVTVQQAPLGIGYFLEGDPISAFSHGGANEGFRAHFFAHTDSGDGIAIMTNSDSGSALIGELMVRVGEIYGWQEKQPTIKTVITLSASQQEAILGDYLVTSPFEATVTITITEDGILVNAGDFLKDMAFLPEAHDTFFSMNGTPLTFEFDDEGNVKAMNFEGVVTGEKIKKDPKT